MRGTPTACRLQKKTETATGTGASETWEDVQGFNGLFLPVSQSEQKIADNDTAFDEHVLHIRKSDIKLSNRTEVTTGHRIVIGARYYNIIGSSFNSVRGGKWKLRLRDVTEQTES